MTAPAASALLGLPIVDLGLEAWDDFDDVDQDLVESGRLPPTGQSIVKIGKPVLRPWIRDGRLARSDLDAFGPLSGEFYYIKLSQIPKVCAHEYVFTPGVTGDQNVVLGSCPELFSRQSIQFAVSREGWQFFFTDTYLDNVPGTTTYTIDEGTHPTPRVDDGETRYATKWTLDVDASSLTVDFGPSGALDQQYTVTGPVDTPLGSIDVVGAYAGKRFCSQVRRPAETDGDARFTLVAAAGRTPFPGATFHEIAYPTLALL